MKKIIIAAVDLNFAIGNQDQLPWQGHQQADMKRFVELTTKPVGFPLVMGRKTYESFPRRPLSRRTNIVITRQTSYKSSGCIIVNSLEDAIRTAELEQKENLFIIGGAEIYRQAIQVVNELYITLIHYRFKADAFFPPISKRIWKQTRKENFKSDEANQYCYSFVRFERRP
ncbi:MAG: dihydrofolate reductase [Candidatus Kaiserbacteria bacterium]|nr:dihydrofolate reductase [Candidatus Kaiserbacteria bacterium]